MKEIVVALSGGVDSAMSVYYLQKEGYRVSGYTFLVGEDEEKRRSIAAEAGKVADFFQIEWELADLAAPFAERVEARFLAEYLRGRTPNPCVICNREIKFPSLLAAADRRGIREAATGHYIRLRDGAILRDPNNLKDQSYVLALLPRAFLPRLRFPMGGRQKGEVRAEARRLGLPVAENSDSQEICFIPDDDYRGHIRRAAGDIAPGDFVDGEGNLLGRHQGLPFYTVGQRKGLGIAFGKPLYVVALDPRQNRVILGEEQELMKSEVLLEEVNFLMAELEGTEFRADVKIRYQAPPVAARLRPWNGKYLLAFDAPQKAVAPGQIAVFYRDDRLIGGGVLSQDGPK